jgi:hypothetical protein
MDFNKQLVPPLNLKIPMWPSSQKVSNLGVTDPLKGIVHPHFQTIDHLKVNILRQAKNYNIWGIDFHWRLQKKLKQFGDSGQVHNGLDCCLTLSTRTSFGRTIPF